MFELDESSSDNRFTYKRFISLNVWRVPTQMIDCILLKNIVSFEAAHFTFLSEAVK